MKYPLDPCGFTQETVDALRSARMSDRYVWELESQVVQNIRKKYRNDPDSILSVYFAIEPLATAERGEQIKKAFQ